MANYKVVDADQLDADMTTVADAIRAKGGTTEKLAWPDGYVDAVSGIEADDSGAAMLDGSITEVRNSKITSLRRYALAECIRLKKVDLPLVTTVWDYAFTSCSSLVTANIPEATTISSNAFNGCSKLQSITLPKARSISNDAFIWCSRLTTVDIPSVQALFARAFQYCANLISLILRGDTVPELEGAVLDGTGIANGFGFIYVPAALVDTYKAATNWSTYAAQFRALEDYTVDGTITGELDPNKI